MWFYTARNANVDSSEVILRSKNESEGVEGQERMKIVKIFHINRSHPYNPERWLAELDEWDEQPTQSEV